MADASNEPEEHHLSVARTARFWTAGNVRTGAELWVVCHGYAQLAGRFIRRFNAIAGDERGIVAPEALNRFYLDARPGPHGPDSPVGATWMTREDRLNEIRDYIEYLDTVLDGVLGTRPTPPRRLVALGFSQGTATVSRWAAHTRHALHEVVLWAGGLPAELDATAALFLGARLTLVSGVRDDMVSMKAMDRVSTRLGNAGLAHACVRHDGGHEVTSDALHGLLTVWDDRA